MPRNIDMFGNEVHVGDILLQINTGFTTDRNGFNYHHEIWEKPNRTDSAGYWYNMSGEKSLFWHASAKYSIKIDMSIMPDGFEYSFKHGMKSIYSKKKTGTILEIINNSNWKEYEIKEQDVIVYNELKNVVLETPEDIVSNIDLLFNAAYTPGEIVSAVLEITSIGHAPVHNGEIGFSAIQDHLNYGELIYRINMNPVGFLNMMDKRYKSKTTN